jgi:hypothetical protein
VFENGMLRGIFWSRRKLNNEEHHNLFSSPSIIRMMRWVGHVARMGKRGMHIGYWWESQMERDH